MRNGAARGASVGERRSRSERAPHGPDPRATWLRERYGLTTQEARVALLIADGDTTTDIATQLGVTVFTVRAHLRGIFIKTDVKRQAALVRLVLSPDHVSR